MLWVAALLLAGFTALFELTDIDLQLQDHLYNFETRRWLIDEKEPVGRLIFYNGPKALVWIAILMTLTLAVGPVRWRDRWKLNRRGLCLGLLVFATVPALAGMGKKYTNTFCPSEIRRYGGDVAYAKLCEPYPADDKPSRRGGCFPAGHASGGFAFLGLLYVRSTRRWRNGIIALALALGWWMGTYQMLKGAHYLSHTVTTMLMAWIIMMIWQRVLRLPAGDEVVGNDKAVPACAKDGLGWFLIY